jgi:phage baseplate assembly protein W
MTSPIYSGYSSVVNTEIDTSLHDLELVKQDLMNHFHTRIGERVGRPNWGSIIWDLLFDLGDDRTEALVVQDAQRIIGEEPRVKLLELLPTVSLEAHSIELVIKIQSVETNMNEIFTVIFQN